MDGQHGLMEDMRRAGILVTRRNFITHNWAPIPDDWTPELERELPEELQDWSLFELINGELVLKKGAFPS